MENPLARMPLAAAALLVALAAILPFLAAPGRELVWDDGPLLAHFEQAWQERGWVGVVSADYGFAGERWATRYWRPVPALSLWAETRLGASPLHRHLVNLVIYALTCSLAFLLLDRLLGSRRAALFGALLFAVNPLHVETAAWISGRCDLLVVPFVFLAAWGWMAAREGGSPWGLPLGSAAFGLALLSKESAVALPLALAGWDLIDSGDAGGGWWRRNRGWLLAWGGVAVAVLAARLLLLAPPGGTATGEEVGAVTRLAALLTDIRLLAVPWPVLTFWSGREVALDPLTVGGALLFAALCVLASRFAPGRWGGKAAVWAGVFLLPVSGIWAVPGPVTAARFLFLPSLASALVAGVLLDRWAGSRWGRVAAPGAALVLALAMGAGSASLARVWNDDLSLFARMTLDAPREGQWHSNLSQASLARGQAVRAVEEGRKAVALDPTDWRAWSNLGLALGQTGDWVGAGEAFARASKARPDDPRILFFWGIALRRGGRPGDAVERFDRALRANPGWGDALRERAAALAEAEAAAGRGR